MRGLWLVACAALLGACESGKPVVDDGVVVDDTACEPGNMPPYVEITSHEDGTVIPAGTTETFEAFVGDPDDALSTLSVDWFVNGTLICEGADIDEEGRTNCDIPLDGASSVVRVEVTDPDGATDEDVVLIVDDGGSTGPANTPPTCEITAPPSGSSGEIGDAVRFDGVVGDAEDSPEELTVSWGSDTLGILGGSSADASGNVSLETDVLSPGSHIIALYVTDTAGASCVDWLGYEVLSDEDTDNPPAVVITSPGDDDTFKAGEDIDFGALVSDIEDAEDTLGIVWTTEDGEVLSTEGPDADGNVGFSTDGLSPGENTITVTVTDSDGNTTTDSITITITENAGPTSPDVQIVPDPAYTNNDLFAVLTAPAIDPDGDPITYTYTWYLDGVFYSEGSSTSIPSEATAKGQEWRVVVVASDGTATSEPVEDSITVQNTPPSIESVDLTPDEASAADTLNCAHEGFFDLDGDGDNSSYAWTINGVYAGSGNTLSGGYGAGDTVTCTVTPNDFEDNGMPRSDAIVINGGGADGGDADGGDADGGGDDGDGGEVPVIADVILAPDPAYTNDNMSCTPSSSSVGVSYSYRWEVNGEAAGGETGSTLSASAHVKHDVIQCFAIPYLGSETGDEGDSNIVVIQNTPPTAPSIHIEPSAPEEVDDLVCLIDEESTDLDGDTISYTFGWTVDGVVFTGISSTLRPGDTISDDATAGGESWVCTVTPFDGEDTGPSDSAGVTIEEECPPLGGDGRDGDLVVTGDTYTLLSGRTTVVGDNPADVAVLEVDDASAFMAGDELLVQATRGATDDCMVGGAGDWQLVRIASIAGDTIYTRDPLVLPVNTSDGSRYQVVRIPQFSSVSVGASTTLTGPAFDGETGGVLVFRTQLLDLEASSRIDMSGRGFRGGSADVGYSEHHGGRSAMTTGEGGAGGLALSPGDEGMMGAGGGAGGGVSASAGGSYAGGGGGGMGAVGGAGGSGDTLGGNGGTHPSMSTAGGGGGADAATSFPTCDEEWGERLIFGNGGQLGGGGGCADGGVGGDSFDFGCTSGAAGGAGGGIVIVLAETIQGAAGARIVADGESGGHGGDGQAAGSGSAAGGGGAGNGGAGADGGRIFIMSSTWGAGVSLIDAHADGGLGGNGGFGGAGSCLDGLTVPGGTAGLDGTDAPASCAGSGGGGVSGAPGPDGQVMVFGFGLATPVSFPHISDPIYGIEFDGGIECSLEL
jgi:hypothetical protein